MSLLVEWSGGQAGEASFAVLNGDLCLYQELFAALEFFVLSRCGLPEFALHVLEDSYGKVLEGAFLLQSPCCSK